MYGAGRWVSPFANDGSLFVTDDGSSSVWHVSYTGAKQQAGE